ncbi:MAG: putative glycosyltransferase [Chloroflexi bacterium OLB14]|nr:MAG: putative glycosyltransferase [Chloroflexi bacterium OLB14]
MLVDGGSSDNTVQIINSFAEKSPIPFQIIVEKGANIARGRNLAIEKAKYEVIAITDCGCRLDEDWLENLIAPFAINPETQVVAGWYRAIDAQGQKHPFKGVPLLDQVEPQSFVPSSRSLALTKSAWKQSGGYPEWLTLTGEDTYFALELKRFCLHWAFVPSAIVSWIGPQNWTEAWKKAYSWSTGNGEIGYNAWLYRMLGKKIIGAIFVTIFIFIILISAFNIFLQTPVWLILIASLFLIEILAWIAIKFFPYSPLSIFIGDIGTRLMQVQGFWDGAKRKSKIDLKTPSSNTRLSVYYGWGSN